MINLINLRKIGALVKKEFLIQSSYKLSFIFSWVDNFVLVMIFYFIAKLCGWETSYYLKEYQTGYFPFVIVGIPFSSYFLRAMSNFSGNVRQEQIAGTLEAWLASPTKISVIVIFSSLWDFFSCMNIIICLFFGVIFFGLNLSQMNFLTALIIFILTLVIYGGIGIIIASFIIVFKKGDPISWIIAAFTSLFSGVFFPIKILPAGLQNISSFLPTTYALRALRHALLQGYSFSMLILDITILFLFCIIILSFSVIIFKYSIRKAKVDGSLSYY